MCLALGTWGARWRETRPENHDPYLALWTLAHLIDRQSLPRARVVVRFDVVDGRGPHRFWLVVGPTEREVCPSPRWRPFRAARTAAPTRC